MINGKTGAAIDIQDCAWQPNTNIATWGFHGGANQRWKVTLATGSEVNPLQPPYPVDPPTANTGLQV